MAIILAAAFLLHPLVVVVSLALLDRSLTETGGKTIEAVEIALLAVLAGYLSSRDQK